MSPAYRRLPDGHPLRGKAAVVENWQRFYSAPKAPFSWKPDHVQVLESGGLGYSTGPVFDPQGKQFALAQAGGDGEDEESLQRLPSHRV